MSGRPSIRSAVVREWVVNGGIFEKELAKQIFTPLVEVDLFLGPGPGPIDTLVPEGIDRDRIFRTSDVMGARRYLLFASPLAMVQRLRTTRLPRTRSSNFATRIRYVENSHESKGAGGSSSYRDPQQRSFFGLVI